MTESRAGGPEAGERSAEAPEPSPDATVEELYSSDTPPPYWVFRSRPEDAQKTIVVCGAPREGTAIGASIVADLGVPFEGGLDAHWGKDATAFEALRREVDGRRDVWGFEHGVVAWDVDLALATLRNPHFIVVMQEPLSVAMGDEAVRGQGSESRVAAAATKKVLKLYIAAVNGSARTEAPAMIVSYDRALRDMEGTVEGIADFLGVTDYERADSAIESGDDSYFQASTIVNLRRSADWRRRLIGRLLERVD